MWRNVLGGAYRPPMNGTGAGGEMLGAGPARELPRRRESLLGVGKGVGAGE